MKWEYILIIILFACVINLNRRLNNISLREGMTSESEDPIQPISQTATDMEAIKQLGDLAKQIYSDGELVIPADVKIEGKLDVGQNLLVGGGNDGNHIHGATYIKNKVFPGSFTPDFKEIVIDNQGTRVMGDIDISGKAIVRDHVRTNDIWTQDLYWDGQADKYKRLVRINGSASFGNSHNSGGTLCTYPNGDCGLRGQREPDRADGAKTF